MASEKRNLYEVMGLDAPCTADEIRSAYKKLALQLHPDKHVHSGLTPVEALAQFQELAHAYDILSDPILRACYDTALLHHDDNQSSASTSDYPTQHPAFPIIFSDIKSSANWVPESFASDLIPYFSDTLYSGYSDTCSNGFYRVFSDLFDMIYLNELSFAKTLGLVGSGFLDVRKAPIMGDSESHYCQVTAFYDYWLEFNTVMNFGWVKDEENNNKRNLRKRAKREYNETVRELAEFVKKRDKRSESVINVDGNVLKTRSNARDYRSVPEWRRFYDDEEACGIDDDQDDEINKKKRNMKSYCAACGKKFNSEKEKKNHEWSKKHKMKVAAGADKLGMPIIYQFEDA